MNTPNKLTLLRVLLIPVFLVVLYWGFPGSQYAALAIFVIASLTDLVDGYIARKRDLVTDFGKFMDPLADKVLVVTAMLWLVQEGSMPAWAVAVVIFREFAVSGLRLIAVEGGKVIAAGWSGKVKTACTMMGLCVMLIFNDTWVDWAVTAVILVTTVYSGIEYFVKNKDCINWKDI